VGRVRYMRYPGGGQDFARSFVGFDTYTILGVMTSLRSERLRMWSVTIRFRVRSRARAEPCDIPIVGGGHRHRNRGILWDGVGRWMSPRMRPLCFVKRPKREADIEMTWAYTYLGMKVKIIGEK
jgi:hypothetical protein